MILRLLAVIAVLAAAVVSWLVLGAGHTAIVLAVVLAVALVTAAGTEITVRGFGVLHRSGSDSLTRGRSTGPLSLQLAAVIVLVIAPLLAALLILGLMMFVSSKDAVLVGVIVVLAGVAGIAAARRVAVVLAGEVAMIRDGLVAVGDGERDVRLEIPGPDELRELANAAAVMIERLAAKEADRDYAEQTRRNLAAAVSHDLRTPITSLRLLAEALDDELVDGQARREYVQRILTHVQALSGLIDDLFELSRLEAGDITWSLEQVALGELVSETVDAMRVHADARHVALRAELQGGLGLARANPEKLQRVLFNLIQNAIRHSPPDSSVVVRAETLAGMAQVEVEDAGTGIAPADRDRVFDAFYRGGADTARTSGGAGLGLAVARAIVEAHGGTIWLPATSRGTRVRFSMPLT